MPSNEMDRNGGRAGERVPEEGRLVRPDGQSLVEERLAELDEQLDELELLGATEEQRQRIRRQRRRARITAQAAADEKRFSKKTSVSDEVVIKFDNVVKTYKLYKNDRARFFDLIGLKRKGTAFATVNANDGLSFEIKRGEGVAFFGHNGAGKSTALKMITGVSHQTSGEVTVNGNVSALLELTAGFDVRLTGRENIELRGHTMGLSALEIEQLEPRVIEFADLGVYIDQPMKTYSSGMKARLGFAFASSVDPDILVVDEALSVGDRAFKRKCVTRMREIMMDENVTVLFVTHATAQAEEFCSRGLVLDQGKLVFDGDIEDATDYYEENY